MDWTQINHKKIKSNILPKYISYDIQEETHPITGKIFYKVSNYSGTFESDFESLQEAKEAANNHFNGIRTA